MSRKTAFLLAAAVAAASFPALATQPPPAQYDHPYRGKVIVRYLPTAEVTAICGSPWALGCALGGDPGWAGYKRGTCIVIQREELRVDPEPHIRHEIGHCNGWPANHPIT